MTLTLPRGSVMDPDLGGGGGTGALKTPSADLRRQIVGAANLLTLIRSDSGAPVSSAQYGGPGRADLTTSLETARKVAVLATGCVLHPGYDDHRRTKHSRGGRSARTRKPAISGEDIRRCSARKRSAESAV